MAYENARVAVDAAIFSVFEDTLLVYLKPREKAPFEHQLELLGGLLIEGETAEDTLARKIKESIPELKDIFFEQFFTFSTPKRDPRIRTVSVGFFAFAPYAQLKDTTNWHDVSLLSKLAFDHGEIVKKAKEYIASRKDFLHASHLLPPLFPLNDLFKVAQVIHQTEYDNRNFRRMVIDSGLVVATKKKQSTGRHRPATLYKFVF